MYNDDKFPLDSGEVMVVIDHHLVRRANDRKLCSRSARFKMGHNLLMKDFFSLGFVAMVHLNGNRWYPFVELVDPIRQRAERGYNEMRTEVLLLFTKKCYQ
jgi:hypothetical protein